MSRCEPRSTWTMTCWRLRGRLRGSKVVGSAVLSPTWLVEASLRAWPVSTRTMPSPCSEFALTQPPSLTRWCRQHWKTRDGSARRQPAREPGMAQPRTSSPGSRVVPCPWRRGVGHHACHGIGVRTRVVQCFRDPYGCDTTRGHRTPRSNARSGRSPIPGRRHRPRCRNISGSRSARDVPAGDRRTPSGCRPPSWCVPGDVRPRGRHARGRNERRQAGASNLARPARQPCVWHTPHGAGRRASPLRNLVR
jgi:hypothetical protein